MTKKEYTKEETLDLARSLRGQFIIGKALYIAVKTLEKEQHPPISDIEQMKEIGENLFKIGYIGSQMSDKLQDEDYTKILRQQVEKKCEEQ